MDYICETVGASDARLLAFAIMPNHLHLVVAQGRTSLGRLMQPLLRRTALLVQRSHGVEGHVFERAFRDRPCHDPEHARNAILYTHLNPVRAGIVRDPAAYRWTSHAFYAGTTSGPAHVRRALAVDDALPLFSCPDEADEDRIGAYLRFVDWRLRSDGLEGIRQDKDAVFERPARSSHWDRRFAPLFGGSEAQEPPAVGALGARRADPGDVARQVLAEQRSDIPLEIVRSAFKGREAVRLRRLIIRRLSSLGYSGSEIARFLRVSDQCVSAVLRSSV